MKVIYPWWNLQRECRKKVGADKLGNDDSPVEDQKSVNEVHSFNGHTKDSKVKTLLQAVVDIL